MTRTDALKITGRLIAFIWLTISLPVLAQPSAEAPGLVPQTDPSSQLIAGDQPGLEGSSAQAPAVATVDNVSSAQVPPAQATAQKDESGESPEISETSKQGGGEWLAAPIPINSPALGAGLEWVVGRVFPLSKTDKISPPSAIGAGGLLTNNGSRGVALGGRFYLKEDKYRITGGIGTADVNINLYGVGRAAANRDVYVPLSVDGAGVLGEFLIRLREDMYIGGRGQFRNAGLSLNREELNEPDFPIQPPAEIDAVIDELSGELLRQRTVSIGPRFQWDTRDNVFYPRNGFVIDFGIDLFLENLGSEWDYQYYKISFNKYYTVHNNQVLALRATGCAAAGDRVPIYDLCLFGASNDLRGYAGGRYQDRRMFATQAEYRWMFPSSGFMGRIGMVAFGGFGAVDRTFGEMDFNEWLPAGGAGLRFRLTKKYPINFRIDYGFGRTGNTLSIGVLEAF